MMASVALSFILILAISWGCTAFRTSILPASTGGNRRIIIFSQSPIIKGPHDSECSSIPFGLDMSTSDDDGGPGEIERLQQAAAKLRADAAEAEKALDRPAASSEVKIEKPAEYTDLADSCWEIT